MLLIDFYKVLNREQIGEGKYVVSFRVNEAHEVFAGHFPENPVVPGVCMMQIIKEITEDILGKKLVLQSLSNVKFMALINPFITPELKLDLDISLTEDNMVKVKNTSWFNATAALKLSAVYKMVSI